MAAETYAPFTGQAPAAATPVTLYTSPAATVSMVALLTACTTTKSPSAQDDSIRVWVIPSGQSAADQYLVICDMVVDATDPYVLNAPIVLNAGDFIQVQSANGTIAFNGSCLQITVSSYETYVPFGGILPTAATPTVLFTSPGGTITLEAWLQACNTTKAGAGANDLIRIWIVPNGQSTGAPLDRYLVACDLTVDPFDPYMRTDLPVLAAGDAIVVYSLNGNVAFNGAGLEMTN